MKALVIAKNREMTENISFWFQLRWPQATTFSVADGNDGVDVAEVEVPDIVIMDLDLPSTDSFFALEEIRLFSDVPLMVLSSSDEETGNTRALDMGADTYMVKPLNRVEFLAKVEALLRRARMTKRKESYLMHTWQTTWAANLINLLSKYAFN